METASVNAAGVFAMTLERYRDCHKEQWNRFVAGSKNGTFLFFRDYMDHHRDRFPDHSVLIYEDGALVALLPATATGTDVLASHAGLTYGGFVIGADMKTPRLLRVFDAVMGSFRDAGVRELLYKPVPHIYHTIPAEEDRYALLRLGARRIRSGLLAVVPRGNRIPFQERRRRGVRKAERAGLRIAPSDDVERYWEILAAMLARAYATRPVHSVEELRFLMRTFPENIRLFGCFEMDAMLAGAIIYESAAVAHVQYIAATDRGKSVGALDCLFDHLLNAVYADKAYFDFGTSEEGGCINQGLIEQKEGFGARAVAQDQYVIDVQGWTPGLLARSLV